MNKQDQVDKIKSIMSKGVVVPDYRFRYGKYRGQYLEEIFKHDKDYLKWFYANIEDLPKKLEKFIEEEVL